MGWAYRIARGVKINLADLKAATQRTAHPQIFSRPISALGWAQSLLWPRIQQRTIRFPFALAERLNNASNVISMFGSMGFTVPANFLNNRIFNHLNLLRVLRVNRCVDIQTHMILQPL